ncbi:hypothetical protein HDU97_004421 [Phlyctochytrium planicorne]|nr:hypothetical protein HDU97_004421 [Phlyctochytrium planicorne]
MLVCRIIAVASIIAGAAAKLTIRSPKTADTLEGVYLVEVAKGVDAESLVRTHLAPAGLKGDDIVGRVSINTDLFTGFSFSVKNNHHEDAIASIPGLKNVFRVARVSAPKPIKPSAVPSTWVPEDIHTLTGVNTVREKLGLTGKGVKVAVIDSGIDYHHEALGGGFGPGYKVAFGYDMVGDDYKGDGVSIPQPDADPLDTCSEESHGTHVAGIVGADALNLKNPEWVSDLPFTGVAPEVTLGAYRVFGCNGGAGNDVIAAAIFKAHEDGADIINMSLGGNPNFNDGPDSIAASRVSAEGSIVFSANGNDGASGIFTGESPGNAALGFGIASFDNVAVPKPYFVYEGAKFEYNPGANNNNWNYTTTYDIVANDLTADETDQQEDGKGAINPAVAGKTALIRWGDSGGSNARCSAAAKAGAVACILYSNSDSVPDIAGSPLIPSLATTHEAGKTILAALRASKAASVAVTNSLVNSKLLTAGTVSDFSSPGLDQELHIKPDLGGIGGQVYSTVSKHVQGLSNLKTPFAIYSGTSMATPYSAGVAALILQAYGRNKPTFDEFRTLLQNTANFAEKYQTGLIDSVAFQGAGLINAYRAATTKTTVYPSRLALNDTQNTQQHYKLTVTNKNTVSVNYSVKHQPAIMVTPFAAGDDTMLGQSDISYTADYATVKFAKNNDRVDALEFTLKAGESKSFNIHFQPPVNATAGLFPIYSGYVVVNGDGDKVASVPYAGMVGRWRDAPVLIKTSANYDNLLQSVLAEPLAAKYNISVAQNATLTTGAFDIKGDFTKPVAEGQVFNVTDSPIFVLPIAATTTRALRVEAVFKGSNWSSLKALGIDRFTQLHIAGQTLVLNPDFVSGELPDLTKVYSATGYPFSRNSYIQDQGVSRPTAFFWQGLVYTNVTDPNAEAVKLPAGKYQIRFAGLKQFGRTSAPVGGNDYDTVLSNSFEIVY